MPKDLFADSAATAWDKTQGRIAELGLGLVPHPRFEPTL